MAHEKSYPDPGPSTSGPGLPFYHTSSDANHMAHELGQLHNVGLREGFTDREFAMASVQLDQSNQMGNTNHLSADNHLAHALDAPVSPSRLARGVLGMDDDLASSARKRQKVSRACDECRRKKVRCDGNPDTPEKVCANCERTKAACIFSRQPLKRGPSKGYIRELASRLDTLESQLGTPVASKSASEGQSVEHEQRVGQLKEISERQMERSRKRTHSQSEGGAVATDLERSPFKAGRRNVERIDLTKSWRAALSPLQTLSEQESQDTDAQDEDETIADEYAEEFQFDADLILEYYRMIHPTYPMLPGSPRNLYLQLTTVPRPLRQAFLLALQGAVVENPGCKLPLNHNSRQLVQDVETHLQQFQRGAMLLSRRTKLVYLQTLILMALNCDNHGPARYSTDKMQQGEDKEADHGYGPNRSEWLARAVGLACDMQLNLPLNYSQYSHLEHLTADSLEQRNMQDANREPDSDAVIGRRLWWIVFMLDCWHAISTASVVSIPENASKLQPSDRHILGEAGYKLTRLSHILMQLSLVLQQPQLLEIGSQVGYILHTSMLTQTEILQDELRSRDVGPPGLVHLVYWHVRLLVFRLTPGIAPYDLRYPALKIAKLLASPDTTITPLNHHFAVLAGMTLVELEHIPELREGVAEAFGELAKALSGRTGLLGREDSLGWDGAVRQLVERRRGTLFDLPSDKTSVDDLGHAADSTSKPAAAATDTSTDVEADDPTTAAAAAAAASMMNETSKNATANEEKTSITGKQLLGTPFDATLLTKYGYLQALVAENAWCAMGR